MEMSQVVRAPARTGGRRDGGHTRRTTTACAPGRGEEGSEPRGRASGLGAPTAGEHAVRHARVQSVRLSQGPLQRRLRLADVHVDSPPGPVHVVARNRDAAEARHLWELEAQRAKLARSAHRR